MTTDPELSVTSLLMLAAYLAFAGGLAGMEVSVRTLISLSLGRVCAQADEASRTATIASKFVGFIAISPTKSMLGSASLVVSETKRQTRQTACLQDSPVRKVPIAAGEVSLRLRQVFLLFSTKKSQAPGTHCTRQSSLPLLPSGPGGVGESASRGTDT